MTQPIMQRLADWYRAAYERLVVEEKKIDGVVGENETVDEEVEVEVEVEVEGEGWGEEGVGVLSAATLITTSLLRVVVER
ncbi:hypothetical protein NEUTE1DRAFT_117547, partial [Neurospora tetrasperma FGSC 2508]